MARSLRPKLKTKRQPPVALSPTAKAYETPVKSVAVLPPTDFGDARNHDGITLQFTDAQRTLVKELATWGVPFKDICRQIINPNTGRPIDISTLHRGFPDEIADGVAEANMKIAHSAYMQAVGWPAEFDEQGNQVRQAQAPIPQMTKWQTQVKLGYKETVVVEQDNNQTTEKLAKALSNLSYDDMLQLREIMQRTRITNGR